MLRNIRREVSPLHRHHMTTMSITMSSWSTIAASSWCGNDQREGIKVTKLGLGIRASEQLQKVFLLCKKWNRGKWHWQSPFGVLELSRKASWCVRKLTMAILRVFSHTDDGAGSLRSEGVDTCKSPPHRNILVVVVTNLHGSPFLFYFRSCIYRNYCIYHNFF